MSFTFTDRNPKVVSKAWGRFRAVTEVAVVTGDLLHRVAGDATNCVKTATAPSTSRAAHAVAVQDGAAGDTIWCALGGEFKAPQSQGTKGAVTASYFAADGDHLGSLIYLGTDGKCNHEGGDLTQVVGYLLARDRMVLIPSLAVQDGTPTYDNVAVSGAATIGSTLTVATDMNAESDVRLATKKTLRMPATEYDAADSQITPKGFALLTGSSAQGSLKLAGGTPGDILGIYTTTGKAHVVTADSGVNFGGSNNKLTYSAINDGVTLYAVSATQWLVLANQGVTVGT